MSANKLAFLCFLIFGAFLAVSDAQTRHSTAATAQPRVVIERVNNMTPYMQLDALEFLKRAYNASGDRCKIFRRLFAEKYTEHTWHVVLYKACSIQCIQSMDLKVDNNDRYLLFATVK